MAEHRAFLMSPLTENKPSAVTQDARGATRAGMLIRIHITVFLPER